MGITWNDEKSLWLKVTRGKSFEELMGAGFMALMQHPNRPNQSYLLFELDGYVWVAPCVNRGDELFLKTAFRSRKYTKLWRSGELP